MPVSTGANITHGPATRAVGTRATLPRRETNPTATLLLNDFDMSPGYERLIEDLGADPDRRARLQSHMHRATGASRRRWASWMASRFGCRPLHGSTLVSGHLMPDHRLNAQVADWPTTPEARRQPTRSRRIPDAVGHRRSSDHGGVPDGGWLNAPTGLVRVDGTPKPAYERLRGLVKGRVAAADDDAATTADPADRVLGDYEVTSRGGRGFALDVAGPVRSSRLMMTAPSAPVVAN